MDISADSEDRAVSGGGLLNLTAWRYVVVALWVGAVLAGSLLDGVTKTALGTNGPWHRMVHMLVFGGTVVVVGGGLRLQGWKAAGIAFGVGALCEALQRAIYIPFVEWQDVMDDGVGAGVGWLVLRMVGRWMR